MHGPRKIKETAIDRDNLVLLFLHIFHLGVQKFSTIWNLTA